MLPISRDRVQVKSTGMEHFVHAELSSFSPFDNCALGHLGISCNVNFFASVSAILMLTSCKGSSACRPRLLYQGGATQCGKKQNQSKKHNNNNNKKTVPAPRRNFVLSGAEEFRWGPIWQQPYCKNVTCFPPLSNHGELLRASYC